jgi:hypothetical protein
MKVTNSQPNTETHTHMHTRTHARTRTNAQMLTYVCSIYFSTHSLSHTQGQLEWCPHPPHPSRFQRQNERQPPHPPFIPFILLPRPPQRLHTPSHHLPPAAPHPPSHHVQRTPHTRTPPLGQPQRPRHKHQPSFTRHGRQP